MAWSFSEHTPVYIQIADRMRNLIIKGDYAPGEQIPSVRQLAVIAAVNPNTMQRAFVELETEGIICSHGTQGRFVTEDAEIIAKARRAVAERLVADFLKRAGYMSIGKDELINMIKEAEI